MYVFYQDLKYNIFILIKDKFMITINQIQIRLIETIQQSGMTQKKIADIIKISQQTVSHYIKGRNLPGLDTLANLCKLLDVDTNYILCQD